MLVAPGGLFPHRVAPVKAFPLSELSPSQLEQWEPRIPPWGSAEGLAPGLGTPGRRPRTIFFKLKFHPPLLPVIFLPGSKSKAFRGIRQNDVLKRKLHGYGHNEIGFSEHLSPHNKGDNSTLWGTPRQPL